MTSKTRLYGIVGHPVAHSVSPLMHNAAFLDQGLDARYGSWDIEPGKLQVAVEGLRDLGVSGFNVTVPYKVDIIPYLDKLSAEAETIGAVNTVVRDDQARLVGYNTDGAGFVSGLKSEEGYDVAGKRVLVLGAGGAARSLVVALLQAGVAKLTVCNRTVARAEQMLAGIGRFCALLNSQVIARVPVALELALSECDLLVNATSLGLSKNDSSPLGEGVLLPATIELVYDMIYNKDTPLLRAAKAAGLPAVDGKGMLIYQGALAYKLWTGCDAPVEIMKAAISA